MVMNAMNAEFQGAMIGLFRHDINDIRRLRETTVGRADMLEELCDKLANNAQAASRQHYVFVGPRGIGKTHLLMLLADSVRNEERLSPSYTVLHFPEENNRILSFADLLLGLTELLADETEDPTWEALYESMSSEESDQTIIDTIIPRLKAYHQQQGKILLILIENLDTVLNQQLKNKQDIHRLRSFLMDDGCATLVATSPIIFDHLTSQRQPLYDFFDIQFVEDLTIEETLTLIKGNLAWEGLDERLQQFDSLIPKIRALHDMTGGNPRLTMMLYGLIARDNLLDVKLQFQKMLDQISPFYQDRIKDLPPQERALLETIALMRSPQEARTPGNIAKRLRKSKQQTSTLLKRMLKAGYLVASGNPKDKRSRLYRIKEGFFDLWLAMSHSRKSRKYIPYIVEFLEHWYTDKAEREGKRSELIERLDVCEESENYQRENLSELLAHLSEVGDQDEQFQSKLTLLLHQKPGEGADLVQELGTLNSERFIYNWVSSQVDEWRGNGDAAIRQQLDDLIEFWRNQRLGDLEKVAEVAHKLGYDFSEKGMHRLNIELMDEALKSITDTELRVSLMLIKEIGLRATLKLDDALNICNEILSHKDDIKDQNIIGNTYMERGRIHFTKMEIEPATNNFNIAKNIFITHGYKPKVAESLHAIGTIQHATGNHEDAINSYRAALDIYNTELDHNGATHILLSMARIELKQNIENAEKHFNQAKELSLTSNNGNNIADIAIVSAEILIQRGDIELAKEKLNLAKELPLDSSETASLCVVYGKLSLIHMNAGDKDSAIDALKQGVLIASKKNNVWGLTTILISGYQSGLIDKGSPNEFISKYIKIDET